MKTAPDAIGRGAAGVELHLRIRIKPRMRQEFLAFLRGATPFYEAPGGIAIRLLEDRSDDHRFIELVLYENEEAFLRDQQRVEHDPAMKAYLETWRALLAEKPVVEVYPPTRP